MTLPKWAIKDLDDLSLCETCQSEIQNGEHVKLTEHNEGFATDRPSGLFDVWCHKCLDKAPDYALDYIIETKE